MKEYYLRQIAFKEIGKKGQEKLEKSTIAIVGLGGIGSAAAIYLARAGVNLILIDRDVVEETNLARQILYLPNDISKPKAIVAKERLKKENPNIKIKAYPTELNSKTIELLKEAKLIIDATDNMDTRFLLNDYCVKNKKPLIYTGAIENNGIVMFIYKSACLRCLYPETKRNRIKRCEDAGILNVAAGLAGMIAASETIKYIVGFGENLKSKIFKFNLTNNYFEISEITKNENCLVCGKKQFEYLEKMEKEIYIFKPCETSNVFQGLPKKNVKLNLKEVAKKINLPKLLETPDILILKYNNHRVSIFKDGRILVKNIQNKEKAKDIIEEIYRKIEIL